MKKQTLVFCLLPTLSPGDLVEKMIDYKDGDTVLEGFYVYDDEFEGPRPGVLVVHQWTGLGDHEKERSRMLAKLGYTAFAADIYGKGIRPDVSAAGEEAGKYKNDRKLYRSRLMAGLNQLKAQELTDSKKLGAIGFCFGGTGVLEMARAGADLNGVVSFHGGLDSAEGMKAEKGAVKTAILVCHGADDPHVKRPEVEGFVDEMTKADADYQLNIYSNAVHSFTQKSAGDDNSKGAAYNEQADERSWEALKIFFNEVFSEG